MKFMMTVLLLLGYWVRSQDTVYYQKLELINYDETTGNNVYGINGDPFTGTAIEYYPSKKMKRAHNYLHGVFEGDQKTWFENGQLQMHTNYVKGHHHGKHTSWYKNGLIKWKSSYFEGNQYDTTKQWYPNGILKSWTHIALGDTLVNAYQMFWDNGLLRIEFLNNIQKSYHRNGVLKEKGAFTNNLKTRKWFYYDQTGKRIKKEVWKNGKLLKTK